MCVQETARPRTGRRRRDVLPDRKIEVKHNSVKFSVSRDFSVPTSIGRPLQAPVDPAHGAQVRSVTKMRYEVEMKFRVQTHDDVESRLRALNAESMPASHQTDIYFQHPHRDFALSHEALRLRLADGVTRITYKGPKLDGPTKTREEIELAIGPGGDLGLDQARTLLARLGFRPVATLRKTRTSFHLKLDGHALEVALDDAENLGAFVEVECIADAADAIETARRTVLDCADRLGCDQTMLEPHSYLRMALELAKGG